MRTSHQPTWRLVITHVLGVAAAYLLVASPAMAEIRRLNAQYWEQVEQGDASTVGSLLFPSRDMPGTAALPQSCGPDCSCTMSRVFADLISAQMAREGDRHN